ncbi:MULTISPECIES: hypothetical protein [unclassified Cellulophaga]|uniref:hypothetical protein n=1 Tax=unclassified Cellulophaga TaxID=2634405 RepID=UPI0026E408EF|nr:MULTISPECIES: hypothetical protein [unclassified Cellulophaga]MDO6492569.1 hypothetical protein [Cellulophaga sp. 2_MG-2023]MDO6493671.1 hypothetical protein [Cellulophaga sp. 3_MG-2023]
MKKLLPFLTIALLFSCENEKLEDDLYEQSVTTNNSWELVSIVQNGIDYTTECDKQNTLKLTTENKLNQIFFDTSNSQCSAISYESANINTLNNEFKNEEETVTGSIKITENLLELTYSGELSGTVITYAKY